MGPSSSRDMKEEKCRGRLLLLPSWAVCSTDVFPASCFVGLSQAAAAAVTFFRDGFIVESLKKG